MRSRKTIFAIVVIAMFSLACGLGNAVTDPMEEAQATVEAAAGELEQAAEQLQEVAETVAPEMAATAAEVQEQVQEQVQEAATEVVQEAEQAQEVAQEAAQDAGDVEEAAVEVGSIDDALAELTSYVTHLEMTFDGVDADGQPVIGGVSMDSEQTKDPEASHMLMSMSGSMAEDMGDLAIFEIYMYDGNMYMFDPNTGWMSFPAGDDDDAFSSGLFTTDDIVDLPDKGRRSLLPQDVNGISTWHYTFNEDDFQEEGVEFKDASGELWVARDGGYPVKLIFEVQEVVYSSEMMEEASFFENGSFSVEYELKSINDPGLVVMPPDEALNATGFGGLGGFEGGESGMDGEELDLPMLDDAEVEFSMPGMLNYYTKATIDDVVNFYRAELGNAQWQFDPNSDWVDAETAMLFFEKDGKSLTVSLGKEDGQVNVTILSMDE